jgi:hypothetical protein
MGSAFAWLSLAPAANLRLAIREAAMNQFELELLAMVAAIIGLTTALMLIVFVKDCWLR